MATTMPMLAPDGTSGDIPQANVQAALKAGFKPAIQMTAPDGTNGYIPADQLGPARNKGFKDVQPQQAGFWENLGRSFGVGTDEAQQAQQHPILSTLESYPPVAAALGAVHLGVGAGKALHSLISGNPAQAGTDAINAVPLVGSALQRMDAETTTHPGDSYLQQVKDTITPGNIGTAAGTAAQVAPALLGGLDAAVPVRPTIPTVANIASALSDAAKGSPDAAALKGLNVSAKSKVALRTIQNTDAARPYLQGVQNLEDLQTRIPQAKAEVWGPYQRTIDAIGRKTVDGPDGPTTIQALEDQRLQLSAINRGLKAGDPATLQLVQQKGLNQADLLAQESAVKDALDPHLEQAGIKPQLIRKTFGQISDVGSKVLGRSTVSETPTAYGIGRAANLSIKNPLAAPGEIASGVRDMVAGRPLFSGSATDVNIREAFRNGGPKPNLGDFDPRTQLSMPSSTRLLPAQSGGAYQIPPDAANMTIGEQQAALMQQLRRRPQLALPSKAQAIPLPASYESLMRLRNGAQ